MISSKTSWNSHQSSKTRFSSRNATWPLEKPRVCVSRKARECGDSGLLPKFRRCLPQAARRSPCTDRSEIDEIGCRLESFPHHRLKGSNRFRARVGDYRIIYTFDVEQNRIHLLAIGHRREIY